MNLDEAQKQKISAWIAEGLKLSEIQKRIVTELGLSLTYMEARLLVDDLKLVPVGTARPKDDKIPTLPGPGPAQPTASAGLASPSGAAAPPPATEDVPATGGNVAVAVTVDAVTRAGALVSGNVRFSDGQTGAWYMDQAGRLGVAPTKQGYKPSAADVEAFQQKLELELSRLGL